jgi:phospholipase/carboxylesterase
MEEKRKLRYEIYLTGQADPTSKLPMIIILHFMGGNPDQMFSYLLKGIDYPTRVIAPYGQYKYEGQYSWFPESLYDEDERNQGKFVREITGILLENVERWEQEYSTEGKPIYLGMSQGGDIGVTLASLYGDRFRLCIPIAGRLLEEEIKSKRNAGKVRIHHGEKDPIVPNIRAREAANRLQSGGMDVKLREHIGIGHVLTKEIREAIIEDIYVAIQE